MSEAADIAVVGAGPAGSVAAISAATQGAKVVVLERAPNAVPRCAGLISMRTLAELSIPEDLILERLSGVVVHGPKGAEAVVSAPTPKAVVVERKGLDRLLRERAGEAGAELRLGVVARGWDGRKLHTDRGPLEADVVIGADGAASGTASWAGLPRPREHLVAYQAEVEAEPCYPGHAEIFLGRGVAPGFFAWAIPAGDRIRVGLGTTEGRRAAGLLRGFLRRRFPGGRIVSFVGGLIPIGPPPTTCTERVLLVGDAAAQVKPLTGGGILFGTVCARIAGELAAAGKPKEYERAWRMEVGREIEFGLLARRAFLSLDEGELDRLVRLLSEPEVRNFLVEKGDYDFPSKLLPELKRSPHLWPLGLRALRALGGIGRFL